MVRSKFWLFISYQVCGICYHSLNGLRQEASAAQFFWIVISRLSVLEYMDVALQFGPGSKNTCSGPGGVRQAGLVSSMALLPPHSLVFLGIEEGQKCYRTPGAIFEDERS